MYTCGLQLNVNYLHCLQGDYCPLYSCCHHNVSEYISIRITYREKILSVITTLIHGFGEIVILSQSLVRAVGTWTQCRQDEQKMSNFKNKC